MAEYVPTKYRSTVLATLMTGWTLGSVVATVLAGWLLPEYGWRYLYYIAIIPIVLAVAMYFLVPEPKAWLDARQARLDAKASGIVQEKPKNTFKMIFEDADPQHYGIGIKELWEIDPAKHKPGLVMHGAGWPLNETSSSGGWWLYHAENNQVTLGMIVDLSYENPHMYPFMEMQRWKTHPLIKQYLEGGKRISYGARAVTKGGFNSLPKFTFPGGSLIGDDAGFLNFAKIKGSHTAMKSGMLCGEAVFEAIKAGVEKGGDLAVARVTEGEDFFVKELTAYTDKFNNSWLKEELYSARNFGPAMHKFGQWMGGAFNFIDQNVFKVPYTLHDLVPDFKTLKTVDAVNFKPNYPKPDGKLTFDRLSSVFVSNTVHEENQPAHLKLTDASIPVNVNLPKWDEPAQRYCPAGVYEIMENDDGSKRFQINAANCVHCKTCDIKDPSQNITWVTPEGGGGPNYPNM
jgi:electron-transferring-flavoprotein dehydrogenase